MASASGLFNFLRLIALSIGTSLTVTLWDHCESFCNPRLTENITTFDPATQQWLAQAHALDMDQIQAVAKLAQEITATPTLSLNEL